MLRRGVAQQHPLVVVDDDEPERQRVDGDLQLVHAHRLRLGIGFQPRRNTLDGLERGIEPLVSALRLPRVEPTGEHAHATRRPWHE